jgi:ATP-dependent RNA helicase DeaD
MRTAERLLREAKVVPSISPPPSADSIRKRDREKLVEEILAMPEGSEEDLEVGDTLLEGREPRKLAALLVQLLRGQRPSPEELPETEATVRKMQAPKPVTRPGVWFRVNLGREEAADPRWLIPLICRRGHIEKSQIGQIRIRQSETWFEVASDAADHFARSVVRPDKKNPGVRFAREE